LIRESVHYRGAVDSALSEFYPLKFSPNITEERKMTLPEGFMPEKVCKST
jgi:hypothetical protein